MTAGSTTAPLAHAELTARAAAPLSPWRIFWRRLRRSKIALTGGIIFGVIVFVSAFASVLAPHGKNELDLFLITQPPSTEYLLGTDSLGRDVLSRLMYGGQISLAIGISAAIVAVVIGVFVGAIAGYYGGWVDGALMRFVDVMLAFPSIFLLLIVAAILDGITATNIVIFLGAFGWMWLARIIRGEFISLKHREFVEAARMSGASGGRIITRHLLPNVVGPITVALTLDIALFILAEASLSFLGFGVKADTPTWGNMLNDARTLALTHPHLPIVPGVMITLVVLSINFIGDGLQDAFDPKGRG